MQSNRLALLFSENAYNFFTNCIAGVNNSEWDKYRTHRDRKGNGSGIHRCTPMDLLTDSPSLYCSDFWRHGHLRVTLAAIYLFVDIVGEAQEAGRDSDDVNHHHDIRRSNWSGGGEIA